MLLSVAATGMMLMAGQGEAVDSGAPLVPAAAVAPAPAETPQTVPADPVQPAQMPAQAPAQAPSPDSPYPPPVVLPTLSPIAEQPKEEVPVDPNAIVVTGDTGLRKRERHVECGSEEIVSRDHRGEYRFPSQANVLDRQIVSLALARALAAGNQSDLTYQVVDRERLEPQRYRALGEETVVVPAGTLRAIKVERLREDSSRTTVTWFGIDQGLIPVRILQSDEGEGFELRLVSLQRQ